MTYPPQNFARRRPLASCRPCWPSALTSLATSAAACQPRCSILTWANLSPAGRRSASPTARSSPPPRSCGRQHHPDGASSSRNFGHPERLQLPDDWTQGVDHSGTSQVRIVAAEPQTVRGAGLEGSRRRPRPRPAGRHARQPCRHGGIAARTPGSPVQPGRAPPSSLTRSSASESLRIDSGARGRAGAERRSLLTTRPVGRAIRSYASCVLDMRTDGWRESTASVRPSETALPGGVRRATLNTRHFAMTSAP